MLSIQVAHVFGDGIGFMLGYRACNTLVGNSPYIVTPVTPANGDGVLYDINTVTGAALLPGLKLPVNAFGIAFTPSSPSGTLYALANHGLYSVNPMGKATLVATPIPSTSPGGLAADPSTGILYGVDRMGNLFKVISGVVTSVGRVGGTYSHGLPQLSAMAFDNSGNLFIVDDGLYLLKVSAPVSPTTVTSATGITLTGHTNLPGIGLAIDPLGGTAYYAQHDQLYTLDLTTGTLGLIGKLGIPFDPGTFLPGAGYLEGLTFVESPLPPSGVCPASPLPSPLPSPTLCCSQT